MHGCVKYSKNVCIRLLLLRNWDGEASAVVFVVLCSVLRLRQHHCHLLLVIIILSYVIIIVPTTNCCCCCFYLCLVIILLLSISSLHNHSYSYSSLFATSATAVVVPLYRRQSYVLLFSFRLVFYVIYTRKVCQRSFFIHLLPNKVRFLGIWLDGFVL